jgi:hypothetical protein
MYSWKSHKEIPFVTILNKQKHHFFFLSFAKSENRKVEQVLLGGLIPMEFGKRWRKAVGR